VSPSSPPPCPSGLLLTSRPAWVVTRPPPSLLPQHNSAPAAPLRHSQVHFATSDDASDDDDDNGGAGWNEAPAATDEQPRRGLPQLFKRKAGRRWDHLRSAEPVIVPRHRLATQYAPTHSASPWRELVESSRYPHIPNEESEVVDEETMAKLQPAFGYPVNVPRTSGYYEPAAHHKPPPAAPAQSLWERVWSLPLRHPLGPLACRLTVLSTSIIALALAARTFGLEMDGSPTPQRTQTVVAIVVDVVAIPYIGYITVDDYTGKPLGLRRATTRIRLILLDLFFIIFKSASTALGFEAMLYFSTDITLPYMRALAAFEVIGLISWAMTLTINVFREIEKLGGE
jgi:hypothetical protein